MSTRPRIRKLCWVVLALLAANFYAFSQEAPRQSDELHQLWSSTIEPNLRAMVQSTDQAETIGATMMVPLHVAFRRRDDAWMHSFAAQFAQFASAPSALPSGEAAEISRLYYLYLASQFAVLAKESGHQDLIPPNLPGLLFYEIDTYWRVTPAWQWNRGPFPGGARERLLWKLQNRKTQKSYYRAVLDHDLYIFAMAADLRKFAGGTPQQKEWQAVLDDVLSFAHRVYTQEVAWQPGGGWVLQPGVWTDHPEYQFAGNKDIHPRLAPSPVPGIATDTSHSLRMPLWLISLMGAYSTGSEDYRFYQNLRVGLEKQFYDKVLVKPTPERPCFLITNFMDGTNGVYRWGYQSLGKDNGYGPYEVSGSFLLGWWAFLDTDMRNVYREAAAQFPWPKECLAFYLGPSPGPNPHADTSSESAQARTRMYHTTVLLATQL